MELPSLAAINCLSPEDRQKALHFAGVVQRSRDLSAWSTHHLRHRLTTYNPAAPPRCGLSDFHRALCQRADELITLRGQRDAWLAARSSGKSTWMNLADPLREAMEGREPFIVIGTDTQPKSRMYLRNIKREIERNPSLAQDYPLVVGPGQVWAADEIHLRNGVVIKAISNGQNIRGLLEQTRPSKIILDDLQGPADVISPLERQRAWDWLMSDLLPLGNTQTNITILGTPVHRESIVNKLRNSLEAPGWTTRVYRAIEQWPERMDLWDQWEAVLRNHDDVDCLRRARDFFEVQRTEMERGSEVLWPEKGYDIYYLMLQLANTGLAAFKSEYQCDPDNPELYEWPGECFDPQKRPELFFDTWPEVVTEKVLALDPSKGSRSDKLGDYSAYIKFGRAQNGVEYVEADMFRGNQDATLKAIIDKGVKHVREFQPEVLAFEAIQFQSLLAGPIRQALQDAQLEVTLWASEDTNPKEVRIRRLTEPIVSRRMRFRRNKGTMILLEQLREFPTGEHEDGCFVAGTMVEMKNGAMPIEFVVIGDEVLTRNGYRRVVDVGCTGMKPTVEILLSDGRTLTGTKDHPVWDGIAWVPLHSARQVAIGFATPRSASNVAENSRLGKSGFAIALCPVRRRRITGCALVYNLTVDGDAEYFANGVLVHNCDALELARRAAIRLQRGKMVGNASPVQFRL